MKACNHGCRREVLLLMSHKILGLANKPVVVQGESFLAFLVTMKKADEIYLLRKNLIYAKYAST